MGGGGGGERERKAERKKERKREGGGGEGGGGWGGGGGGGEGGGWGSKASWLRTKSKGLAEADWPINKYTHTHFMKVCHLQISKIPKVTS